MSYALDEDAGRITVTDGVLDRLVVVAAERVDGARARRPRRGLDLQIEDGHVRVALELTVQHGRVLPEVARAVQASVADALRTMCGLEVVAVDLHVEELE